MGIEYIKCKQCGIGIERYKHGKRQHFCKDCVEYKRGI
tara:strand:- start:2195 stop:2308 length:114 start_codon:yes stop_codon:yes gene_type:complete